MRRTLWLALPFLLAAAFVATQLLRPLPPITLRIAVPAAFAAGGPAPDLPWPTAGQSAVAVAGVGSMGTSGATSPQPIASLAKMMVAALILRDHPLAPGQNGPTVTVTAGDVAVYRSELAGGQSVLPVVAGETLTERQLLQGLLIPSGNNIADLLAAWDAGSRSAFVARMNAEAARLGMTSTHYADASGVSAATVSTAVDQLRIAEAAMAMHTFRNTVAMAQATLPGAGTVFNVNYFLGHGGIIGVKTGSTGAAGGCYVAAAYRTVAGRSVLVLASVLGQGGVQPLLTALNAGLNLLNAAGSALTIVQPVHAGQVVATLSAPWAGTIDIRAPSSVSMIGWKGLAGTRAVTHTTRLTRSVAAGSRVGTLQVALGSQHASLALKAPSAIPAPSLLWRLRRV